MLHHRMLLGKVISFVIVALLARWRAHTVRREATGAHGFEGKKVGGLRQYVGTRLSGPGKTHWTGETEQGMSIACIEFRGMLRRDNG